MQSASGVFAEALWKGQDEEAIAAIPRLGDLNRTEYPGAAFPLLQAAYRGRTRVVAALLDAGAGVNQWSRAHWTALMAAAWEGHLETAKLLLSRGANPALKNAEGRTAADLAEGEGHKAVAAALRAAAPVH